MRLPLLFAFTFPAFLFATSTKFDCLDVQRAQVALSVHASNFLNRESTRTPEGGVYLRKELRRTYDGGDRIVDVSGQTRLRYEPTHPDASAEGMVAYPDVDRETEIAGMETAVARLELFAQSNLCDSQLLKSGSSILVKYGPQSEVGTDTFVFTDRHLSAWTRDLKTGAGHDIHF